MAISIGEQVRRTFNLVALRAEAKALLTGRQWEQREALVRRCYEARQKAEELNFKRHETRVEVVRQRMIDEAGAKTREHKPFWAQYDRFDKAAILRLAQREVRQIHERRIAQINQYETRGLSNLLAEAKRENQLQGKAERAFNRDADRRDGQDRRKSRTQTRKHRRLA